MNNIIGVQYWTPPKPFKRKVEPIHKASSETQTIRKKADKESEDCEPSKVSHRV